MALEDIALPASRIDGPMLASLRELLGEESVHADRRSRVEHACGKSYRNLARIRAGHILNPPDAVVYPNGEADCLVADLGCRARRDCHPVRGWELCCWWR